MPTINIEAEEFQPAVFDLPLYGGNTFKMELDLSDYDPETEITTPRDITDYIFKGDIKTERNGSATPVGSFRFVKDGGTVVVILDASVATALNDNSDTRYVYDIQYRIPEVDEDNPEEVYTILTGSVIFTKEVTR